MPTTTKAQLGMAMARIGVHVLHEHVTRPRPKDLESVPRAADSLTREWLTAALCKGHPGAEVKQFFLGERNDGTTARRAIVVDYNDAGKQAGLPTRVFVKCSATFVSRLITGLTGAAEAEAQVYTIVRPQLDIESPAAYHAAWDRSSCRSTILLEDVSVTRGVTFCDPTETYVTKEMAESQIDLIATYHGAFWQSPQLATFPWLKTALEFQETVNDTIDFETRTMIGIERAEHIIPAEFTRRRGEVYAKAMKSLELHAGKPQTLLHQDVHVRNWYETPAGAMGLFDWQCVAKGHWALDFAYMLMSGLRVEDRRAWEKDLLKRYLEQLKVAGGEPPSFDEAWLDYRQQVFHGLIFWLYTIGQGRLQPDMQPRAVSEANVSRMARATIDLESLDAL